MAKFTIEITDADQIAAITAARTAYNITAATSLDTDAAYIQFVMDGAVASWAAQYADPIVVKDRLLAAKDARIAQLEAEVAAKG